MYYMFTKSFQSWVLSLLTTSLVSPSAQRALFHNPHRRAATIALFKLNYSVNTCWSGNGSVLVWMVPDRKPICKQFFRPETKKYSFRSLSFFHLIGSRICWESTCEKFFRSNWLSYCSSAFASLLYMLTERSIHYATCHAILKKSLYFSSLSAMPWAD